MPTASIAIRMTALFFASKHPRADGVRNPAGYGLPQRSGGAGLEKLATNVSNDTAANETSASTLARLNINCLPSNVHSIVKSG